MAITAGLVIEGAIKVLQDGQYVVWPEADLIYWINDGLLRLVQLKPESNAEHEELQLTTPGCQYDIPSDSIQFLSAVRNLPDGAAINYADKQHLDAFDPAWMQPRFGGTGEKVVKEYAFDPKSPRKFYVYPYNNGNGSIEIVTSKVPTRIEDAEDELPCDDVFAPALIDYVLYRCLDSQTQHRAKEDAKRYWEAFLITLGLDSEVDTAHDPKETEGQPR